MDVRALVTLSCCCQKVSWNNTLNIGRVYIDLQVEDTVTMTEAPSGWSHCIHTQEAESRRMFLPNSLFLLSST